MNERIDMGIDLPDGTRLSARVWMPIGAEAESFPTILEYIPYRKSDGTIDRDETMYPWFAERGFACLRVDRRGCGDSEGLFDDEYSEQELQDGEDIIAWIASQPWSNGKVGIQGISWGGFNGLQLAARRPEALKAVISIGTTVDRYTDDIHYKGGIQLGENIGWAATAASWFSTPPDPKLRPDWRETWLNRLENAPFLADRWTRHSSRDAYWRHGSVREDYDQFNAAILVMGGQHDGYRNAMAAMVENADCPVQGIMGPWSHKYPHISTIGPSIDYLNVALRWWNKWLKDEDNGADQDPAYRTYVMDSVAPDTSLAFRPGRWLAFPSWPAPEIEPRNYGFSDGILGESAAFSAEIGSNSYIGRASGEFFPFGFGPGELPDDQTLDDAHSMCFDSSVLEEDLTVVGAPEVRVSVSCDKPRGQLIARLCDVRPDGTVALISLGFLNLRFRNGFDQIEDLTPGEVFDVSLVLDQSAYRLPAGHKLRISISGSYWPYCWPEGEDFTLTITGGALKLPSLVADVQEVKFDLPADLKTRPTRQLLEKQEEKSWGEHADGRIMMTILGDHGRKEDLGSGIISSSKVIEKWYIDKDDPAAASVEVNWSRGFGRGNWGVETELVLRMTGGPDDFLIEEEMRAWEGQTLVFDRKRDARVKR